MPASRYVALLGVTAVGAAVALTVYVRPRGSEHVVPPSVRFHHAVRANVSDIAASEWDEDDVARRWAAELLEAGEVGSDQPVLPALGAPDTSVDDDRIHLLVAMVASRVKEAHDLPVEVLLEESEAIRMNEVDPALVPLAEAVRDYVRADAGRCDQLAATSNDENDGLLDGIRDLLIDGARSCCAVRNGDRAEARDRVRRLAEDAERLGVAVDRVPLLRAWASFADGDTDDSGAQLDRIEVEHLGDTDLMRYRMLRSALSHGDDTILSILDPRWLSSIVVEGIVEAVGRDAELSAHVDESAAAQAALRFVQMEMRLIREARDLHPLFDHRVN